MTPTPLSPARSVTIGLVLFPKLTQLDLTGPFEVFARLPQAQVLLVAASTEAVSSETGLLLVPDTTFTACPPLDVLCVPGGPGINAQLENEELMAFLRRQGPTARYVTSVCTGALLLAAAGLLDGYRATTHWLALDLLARFPVQVVGERVVADRNRLTGGGVTAGIDLGLRVAAELCGEAIAREIQLFIEYNPSPPFDSGSPHTASPELVQHIRNHQAATQLQRDEVVERVLQRRKAST